ncbi:class I SAM-dependent methyltransferase [Longimicrobium sp.]|uniref:class I SAM-dependent methyltransferase n=1 Tax=Longimicrobium sp. TaxID=2029185 RepID=UPI002CB1159B|nr:class I SAM-dependent methyltransferase [Longimicrobium sp.]HSU18049.1 class I SAM-dependent methyltransferase [Longimicrobium sp.]
MTEPHRPADWDNFRVERIRPLTFWKRNLIHQELLRAVLRRAKGGILEVGIGSGAQSALLSRWAERVVSIDNDPRIMRAARPNVERFGPKTRLVLADAFRMPFRDGAYGVSLSQGLMEHFDDDAIAGLVREQLRVCRSVVFSIPSDRYPRQDVGNERLMPPERWRQIAERVAGSGYVVAARYYRADLEAWKYSALARRWLGSFSVLVTIDPRP